MTVHQIAKITSHAHETLGLTFKTNRVLKIIRNYMQLDKFPQLLNIM